jgi:hypothetical protein
MSSQLTVRWCAECRAEQLFEVPPCADGHGSDCPDLACTGCGSAVVVGTVLAVVEPSLPGVAAPFAA